MRQMVFGIMKGRLWAGCARRLVRAVVALCLGGLCIGVGFGARLDASALGIREVDTSQVSMLAVAQVSPSPVSQQVYVAQTFTIDVYVDAGTQPVSAVDLHLSFDPSYLRLTTAPSMGPSLPQVMANSYSNATGHIDMGAFRTGPGKQGRFRYCTLSFRGQAQTSGAGTNLTSRGTLVAAPGGVEITSAWTNANVKVLGSATATNTPTRTRTFTPTATVTPTQTLTPTITPTDTPIPSPTSTSTPGLGSLCFSVFEDPNENRVQDPGEPLLAGAHVTVQTLQGDPIADYVTDGVSEPRCVVLRAGQMHVVTVDCLVGYLPTGPCTAYIVVGEGDAVFVGFGQKASPATPTPTASPTSTTTLTPSVTGTPTDTVEPTETLTPSTTPTPSITLTPSETPTPSMTPTPSPTPGPGEVCITAFEDFNENGIREPDEPLIAGVGVEVATLDGTVVIEYTTDGVSEPLCVMLNPGQVYILTVDYPEPYVPVGPTAVYIYPLDDRAIFIGFGQRWAGPPRSPTPTPTPSVTPTTGPSATSSPTAWLWVLRLPLVLRGWVVAPSS